MGSAGPIEPEEQRTTAVVTGTSRGIGRALALQLAERGVRLVMLARPSEEQRGTEALLTRAGHEFLTLACHLDQPASVAQAAAQVLEQVGAPDLVVHNAATIERAAVEATSDAAWERQLEVNLSAPFRLTRALLPAMRAADRGRILFVSSISAKVGTERQGAYHASKAGLIGLMRCLAEELSGTGLMTSALLPGSVDTRMLSGSGFKPRMTAKDVAQSLAFFALDASRAHNGAVIEMFGA